MSTLFKKLRKAIVGQKGRRNESNRRDWVRQALSALPAGARILDAGAGSQQYKSMCAHLRYVSQDFGKYDGVGDRTGLQKGTYEYGKTDIISDIERIPEPDGSFDAILCTEVFEHIPSPETAIREFSRLLKIGGYLILTAPFASLTHYAPYHFFSGFNRYFYEHFLPKSGFTIIEISKNGNLFDFLAQEISRMDSVARKYAGARLGLMYQGLALLLLRRLNTLSRKDSGSGDVLCFGYHVLSRKEKQG